MEEAFQTLRSEGTTILFSSHNMDQVEALCDDVVLLHRSRLVLAGSLREVKRAARRQTVKIRVESGDYTFLRQIPGISARKGASGDMEVSIPAGLDPNLILRAAMEHSTVVEYSLGEPSLREIYLEKVGGADA